MSSYAVYVHPAKAPLLLRDRYSVGAAVFGPVWLLAVGAWIPGLLVAGAMLIGRALLPASVLGPAWTGAAVLLGLLGQDLRGWQLRLRGWRLAHVVQAADADAATMRLLTCVPEHQAGAV